MSDLSSPEMQKTIKSLGRLNACLYVVLGLLLIACGSLNIFIALSTQTATSGLNWAQILYIVILSATVIYGAVMEIVIRRIKKPYVKDMQRYVSENFEKHAETLKGGKNVEISVYVEGENLVVAKQGSADLVSFDLSSVNRSYNVCGLVLSLAKQYVAAYYMNNLTDGYYSVVITDATGGKPKLTRVIDGGAPVKPKQKNPYLIKEENQK